MKRCFVGLVMTQICLLPGCGFELVRKVDSTNSEVPVSERKPIPNDKITVSVDSRDAKNQVNGGIASPVNAVSQQAPASSMAELGTCLVQAEELGQGSSPLFPISQSAVPKKSCANTCNAMITSAKFFAGSGGCKYSCDWNSKSIVTPFSSTETCTVAVASAI